MAKLTAKENSALQSVIMLTRSKGFTVAEPTKLKKLVDEGYVEFGAATEEGGKFFQVRATQKALDEFPEDDNSSDVEAGKPVSENTETQNIEGNMNMDNVSVTTEEAPVDPATVTAEAPAEKAKRVHKTHVMVDPSTIVAGLSGLPPVGKRGGGSGRKSVYDFDGLAAPMRDAAGNVTGMAFFFVPATADRPEPARSLNATVSGANKKAKEAGPAADTGAVKEFKVYEITHDGVKGAGVYRIA